MREYIKNKKIYKIQLVPIAVLYNNKSFKKLVENSIVSKNM